VWNASTTRTCSGCRRRGRRHGNGPGPPARERAWAAGAGPDLADGLINDIDATITIAHSEKINAEKTWKKTFGFHPLLAYLDRPDVSGGEGLAGILRPGNAGSNTTADHVEILGMALAALPDYARPRRVIAMRRRC
jgi:hypothetical protein